MINLLSHYNNKSGGFFIQNQLVSVSSVHKAAGGEGLHLVASSGWVRSGVDQDSPLQGTDSNSKMSFSVSAMTIGLNCCRPPSSWTFRSRAHTHTREVAIRNHLFAYRESSTMASLCRVRTL